ncbi:MAG TPA: GNAT family N-acetyltransferase [Candidatus Saccharimonadia bacterium]|nr:GNAT family N-acetyltransferase [Candidatus Saccharimonadia bacterium]
MTGQVRLARGHDAPALSELMRRLFLQAYAHSADAGNVARLLEESHHPERQAREIADKSLATLIVEHDGVLSGYAQLRYRAPPPVALPAAHAAQLWRLYLDAHLHGSGTGRALVDDVVQRAAASGADALWLSVWQQAPRAMRFYEKCGFRTAGTTVFMVGEHPTDDWVMWRKLATTGQRASR